MLQLSSCTLTQSECFISVGFFLSIKFCFFLYILYALRNRSSPYRGHIRNQKQYNNAQQLLQELIHKAQNSQQTEPRSSRRGRNPSNTQSTSSSTSRSKTRTTEESSVSSTSNSKKSQKKSEKTTRKESPQVSELDNKEFRAYWKEKGFNETIKKLTAGNLTPGSALRKVFEKKMFAYLEK